MLKNVFRQSSSSLSFCKPGVNNPVLLQKCQVLQLLFEHGLHLLINGAGTSSFSHAWSCGHHTQASFKGGKLILGVGAIRIPLAICLSFFPIYLVVIMNCSSYRSSHVCCANKVGDDIKALQQKGYNDDELMNQLSFTAVR